MVVKSDVLLAQGTWGAIDRIRPKRADLKIENQVGF